MILPLLQIAKADFDKPLIFFLFALAAAIIKIIKTANEAKKNPQPQSPETSPAPLPELPPPPLPPSGPVQRQQQIKPELIRQYKPTRRAGLGRVPAKMPQQPVFGAPRSKRAPLPAERQRISPPLPQASTYTPTFNMPVISLAGASRATSNIFPSIAVLGERRSRRASSSARWLKQPHRMRTAMVVHEILGPPRASRAFNQAPDA